MAAYRDDAPPQFGPQALRGAKHAPISPPENFGSPLYLSIGLAPTMTKFVNLWSRSRAQSQLRSILGTSHRRVDKLDAICANPFFDIKALIRPDLFLDASTIDRLFSILGRRVGAIPAHAGGRFAQSLARRIALRLGRQFEHQLQIPAKTLAEAWYFLLWCELCTLIPIRHLARHIAKLAGGDPVFVSISAKSGTYLSYWNRSDLEPLVLVTELRRAGATAVLVLDGSIRRAAIMNGTGFTLRLKPNPCWNAQPISRPAKPSGKKAVVLSGMRGHKHVLAQVADPLLIQGMFASTKHGFHKTLLKNATPLPTINLVFTRQSPSGRLPNPLQHLSCDLRYASLSDWLFHIIGNRTKSAAAEARRLVADDVLEEAHVCDHMFFESALVAHAVRTSGGRVIVWPHSSNAVHVDMHGPRQPDHVHCMTRASSEIWNARFNGIPRTIVSDLMLEPCGAPRSLAPNKPVAVVVIAGNHNLNRMPVLDIQGHTNSYRRLFSGLSAMAPDVRFLCKAKAPWESMAWLRSLAQPGIALEETRESPTAIDIPNMIFITVSFGSSAILEGLGRGIPSMVVREIAVEDYVSIDPESVPIGPVDMILGELRNCLNSAYFSEVARRQLVWYESQTSFSATGH